MIKGNIQPLVSIIIPTYKRPHMLPRAIQSALNQTYITFEIIVVDDNDRSDEFRQETETFMLNYSLNKKVIYIKHDVNLGGSEARNTGIKNAKGQYITFLDDDDEYLPDKIEKQVKILNSNAIKNFGFVYCGMNYVNSNNEIVEKLRNYHTNKNKLFEEQMIRGIIGTPMLLVPNNVFKEIGGFKTLKYGQDYELILRILANKYEIGCVPEELINVYEHDERRISESRLNENYIEYFFNIKKDYLFLLSKYKIRKVLFEHDYLYFRLNCKKHDFKLAIRKYSQMWFRFVLDFRLIYAPVFIIKQVFIKK